MVHTAGQVTSLVSQVHIGYMFFTNNKSNNASPTIKPRAFYYLKQCVCMYVCVHAHARMHLCEYKCVYTHSTACTCTHTHTQTCDVDHSPENHNTNRYKYRHCFSITNHKYQTIVNCFPFAVVAAAVVFAVLHYSRGGSRGVQSPPFD